VHVAAVLIPLQIFVGDLHGLNTLEHQPAKIAAMEGDLAHRARRAAAAVRAWPNEKERRNDFAIEVPKVASLILTHEPTARSRG
jgi:cytochrome d ubiquinol oxidase subunit I